MQGAFKRFRHEHFFSVENRIVVMEDVIDYDTPLGFLGRLANQLFLEKRNQVIKEFAESERWKEVL